MRRPFTVLVLSALALGAVLTVGPSASAAVRPPERIVSLSPTATEMLFAIGAGKQVVAVDDQSDYPANAPTTDLSGFQPNTEAIAGYDPDLVVVSDSSAKQTLESLGVDVLVLPAANKLSDSYAQLRRLGRVTGHEARAERVVDEMKSDIADLASQVPDDERPSAYYELDETYFSADSSTFIGRLLKMAGFTNIADAAHGEGSGYPQLSAEAVVDADPDVVFLADGECCGQDATTLAARPGFGTLAAVRDGAVVVLDDDVASRWGPRVVDLLRTLVKARAQS